MNTPIVRKEAIAQYRTECQKEGQVQIGSDFLQDESYESITLWLTFMARAEVARRINVKFVSVQILDLTLEN